MSVEGKRWEKYIDENYPWLVAQSDEVIKALDAFIEDESKAGPEYRNFADLLRSKQRQDLALIFDKIASDEDSHMAELKRIKDTLTK